MPKMNKAQQKFGEPNAFIKGKVQSVLDAVMQDFIAQSSFVVLATSNAAVIAMLLHGEGSRALLKCWMKRRS